MPGVVAQQRDGLAYPHIRIAKQSVFMNQMECAVNGFQGDRRGVPS
jgi:hypothetical protein